MIIIFMGPPGSGKGTQAKVLAEKLAIPHISLGDLLREEVRQGSELGRRAQEFMNAGKLVPDELTIKLADQRTSKADCVKGFLIDGYPRSLAQAEAFDRMLEGKGLLLDYAVYFAISEDEVVKRLGGRRSCAKCGAVYHVDNLPPKKAGICDQCGSELAARDDDQEAVIRTRFEVYAKQTSPVIDHYRKQGKLVEINAARPINQVLEELLKLTAHAAAL